MSINCLKQLMKKIIKTIPKRLRFREHFNLHGNIADHPHENRPCVYRPFQHRQHSL
ncbi:hypothetical protein Barb4_02335 [Bacteroidales bacterium Barb4]|nr:hypothetical protein Barb4_02335 [Bacteroidales bacterium Barb4]